VGVKFVRPSVVGVVVDLVDFVDFVDASVASPKQKAGSRTSSLGGCVGGRVEDVIDDVAVGRTAGPLALGETLPPRRLKEGERSPVASVPSSESSLLLQVVVDDTPVVVVGGGAVAPC